MVSGRKTPLSFRQMFGKISCNYIFVILAVRFLTDSGSLNSLNLQKLLMKVQIDFHVLKRQI